MEAIQSYGWSLVNSLGVKASCMIFKTKADVEKYRDAMNQHHPEGGYSVVELFVKKEG